MEVGGGTMRQHIAKGIMFLSYLSSNFFIIHQLIRLDFRFQKILSMEIESNEAILPDAF
jgi:hypothetical protein